VLWLAVILYLALFFLVLHFVDRLASARPVAGGNGDETNLDGEQ
jgi:hypothetical protein